jgi:hypothetical protein|eukprot:scaffold798_cov268-Chaetoceros_neogracile.AAC.25
MTHNISSFPNSVEGWGIGTPIDMQDEEFSKGGSARRRRRKSNSSESSAGSFDEVAYSAESAERAANKYALEDAMEFSQRVRQEKDNLQSHKKNDLLEIAKIAGLSDRLKPKVNESQEGDYGKFEDGFDDGFDDDLDSLDVRVL